MDYFHTKHTFLWGLRQSPGLLLLLLLGLCTAGLRAEGTKEAAPNSTDVTMLLVNDANYGSFAAYNGPANSRLQVTIANPGSEQVFLGFSRQASMSNGTDGNLSNTAYYFRIKDPNGNVVYGPQVINATTANADTWALANAGPAPVVGSGGYTPFTLNTTGMAAGDYWVEFSTNFFLANATTLAVKFWDITVATTGSSPQAIPGRVWSKRWAFRTPSISQGTDPTYTFFDRPFNGRVYLYTTDIFVSKVDFNGSGFRGLSFNLAYNQDGTLNTGDFETNRRSTANANNTLTEYQVFLNDPDPSVFPNGVLGEITASPLVADCNPSGLCISYAVTQPGFTFALLDFDQASGVGLYDPGTADVLLAEDVVATIGEAPPYERCIPWDGLDGLGNVASLSSAIPIYLSYSQGMVHFPVYDVEFNTTGFLVTPVRPLLSGFAQEVYYDDTNIGFTSGNGAAQQMVNGCSPPCHAWTNLDYGNLNTMNTWWYTSQDVATTITLADCTLNAFIDFATTNEGTPVAVSVLANDQGIDLNPASVSNVGVLPPGSGTLSINPATGVITYTPAPGFIGVDSFEYVVCEMTGSPCDTALVIVTVSCGSGTGNTISGLVFYDENADGIVDNSEPGQTGVTLSLYQDNNKDGLVDGGDTPLTTMNSDPNGEYSFTVTPTFTGSNTLNDIPAAAVAIPDVSCSTPVTRTFVMPDNLSITDVNLGFNASHATRSHLRVILTSPQGTSVTVINSGGGDSNDNYDLLLDSGSGNALNDGNLDNTAAPYFDRTAAPSNSLNAFNGQTSAGTWTLSICDNTSTTTGTYNLSQLQISGTTADGIFYVVQVDASDFPSGAVLSTSSVQVASFTTTGQHDCGNQFGYDLPPNAGTAAANDTLCLNGSGLALINLFDQLTGEESGGTWSAISGTPGLNFNASIGTLNPNGLPNAIYTFRYRVLGAPLFPDDTADWNLVIERCCPTEICLPLSANRN